jgi:hypothetical protein
MVVVGSCMVESLVSVVGTSVFELIVVIEVVGLSHKTPVLDVVMPRFVNEQGIMEVTKKYNFKFYIILIFLLRGLSNFVKTKELFSAKSLEHLARAISYINIKFVF